MYRDGEDGTLFQFSVPNKVPARQCLTHIGTKMVMGYALLRIALSCSFVATHALQLPHIRLIYVPQKDETGTFTFH
jgi:hypothetical protein